MEQTRISLTEFFINKIEFCVIPESSPTILYMILVLIIICIIILIYLVIRIEKIVRAIIEINKIKIQFECFKLDSEDRFYKINSVNQKIINELNILHRELIKPDKKIGEFGENSSMSDSYINNKKNISTKIINKFIFDLEKTYSDYKTSEFVQLKKIRGCLKIYDDFDFMLSVVRQNYPEFVKLEIDNQGNKLIKLTGNKSDVSK